MRVHLVADGMIVNTIEAESMEVALNLYPDFSCIEAAVGGIGDRVVDGVVQVQEWKGTLDALIAARCADVDAERDRRMALYLHDFGAPHGVLGLQLRDADDKANWLTLKDTARDLIAAGQGAALLPLRTTENVVLQLSAEQIVAVLGSMAAHGASVLAASWAHKDAIRALATVEPVATYDITTGWPE